MTTGLINPSTGLPSVDFDPTGAVLGELQPFSPTFNQTKYLRDIFDHAVGQLGVPDPATAPMEAYRYMRTKNEVLRRSALQRPLARIWDGSMNPVGTLTGEMSGAFEELYSDSGKANGAIRFNNWMGDYIINQTKIHEDLHITFDPIPTAPTWETRWGGKITGLVGKKDERGVHTIEFEALSNREHAKKLLFGANPFFAPEVQLPKMWVLPGNTRTILATSMFINLARLFFPPLSIPTNIFNPNGWINPLSLDAISNLDPLNWPLQVCYVDAGHDVSRTGVLGATWTDWHSTMDPMIKDAGVIFRSYTWLKEDTTTVHTELAAAASLLGEELIAALGEGIVEPIEEALDGAFGKGYGTNIVPNLVDMISRPKRNCIGFALEDKSGRSGMTGTAADGVLNVAAVTIDDLLSPYLVNLDTQETLNGEPIEEASGETRTNLFEELLGVAYAPPKAIWWDGQYSGVLSSERRLHKGPVKTVMTGGRSPSLVNEAQTFGIRYALSQLGQAIDKSIGWGVSQTTGPGAGLDNLYQGQLDNVLFAWERSTDPLRALYTGDMAWQEVIEKGTGVAYTLSSILTLRVGIYKTRAWEGFTATVMNGYPWLLDVDVRLGERAGFEQDQIIFVDQISAIKREWDRSKFITSMAIGDDSDKEDPFGRGMRFLAAMWSTLGQFLGEGTIFG